MVKNITKEVAKTDKTLNKILSQLTTLNKKYYKNESTVFQVGYCTD